MGRASFNKEARFVFGVVTESMVDVVYGDQRSMASYPPKVLFKCCIFTDRFYSLPL